MQQIEGIKQSQNAKKDLTIALLQKIFDAIVQLQAFYFLVEILISTRKFNQPFFENQAVIFRLNIHVFSSDKA
jgi:hypothetical protein